MQSRPGSEFFQYIMRGTDETVPKLHLERALLDCFESLRDFDNDEFTMSANDRTRAGFWDGIRRLCSLLAKVGYLPHFSVKGTIPHAPGTRTPVLADLFRENGRLPTTSSWLLEEDRIIKENIDLLQSLRDELEAEFSDLYEAFQEGQRIVTSTALPTVVEIDKALHKEGLFSDLLGRERK
ncbi:MAG: hypothetical protein U5N27_04310 [Rhizobium sp.]|nr:hypothetical protein [Rhizobium sp.]